MMSVDEGSCRSVVLGVDLLMVSEGYQLTVNHSLWGYGTLLPFPVDMKDILPPLDLMS